MDVNDDASLGSVALPEDLSAESWQHCVVAVLTALECSDGRFVVECSALRSFDEAGLAMLLGLSQYSQRRQVRVVLANPPATLRETIEVRGMGWLFEWHPLVT